MRLSCTVGGFGVVFVCMCHAVTDREIGEVIADGARTEREIGQRCGAGTDCGGCVEHLCELLRAADPTHGCPVHAMAS